MRRSSIAGPVASRILAGGSLERPKREEVKRQAMKCCFSIWVPFVADLLAVVVLVVDPGGGDGGGMSKAVPVRSDFCFVVLQCTAYFL